MSHPPPAQFDLDRVVVRLATESDFPHLRDLFIAGLIEGQVPGNDTGADIENLHEAYFADEGHSAFWVAQYNGEVVGMIGVQRTSEDVAEVRRLRVHHDYRRRGVGTRLMEQAVNFCRHHGYLKVILDVRIERGPAIAMFEKFGFRIARSREVDGRKMLDFYLDLYRDPGSPANLGGPASAL
jgi:N-acetylglutamate synthase-like GNAT family acetyltransferase